VGEAARPSSGAPAALRTYLELASGLGEVSRKQVRKVVKELIGKGNSTAEQVKAMTGDLLAANTANREALSRLVRAEVDRALGRVGLATLDEVNELNARVHDLERQLRDARRSASAPAGVPIDAPTGKGGATVSKETAETSSAARATKAQTPQGPEKRAGKRSPAADRATAGQPTPSAKKTAPGKAARKVTTAAATGAPAAATSPVRRAAARKSAPLGQEVVARKAAAPASSTPRVRPLREGQR
jgi:polyhydroxyalkanoate synthesis regulator phasin